VTADGEVLLVRREGGVARLTLNRPDKRNALDAALIAALKAALRAADDDPGVRVVAVEGAGRDFCSGADLSALRTIAEGGVMENLDDVEGWRSCSCSRGACGSRWSRWCAGARWPAAAAWRPHATWCWRRRARSSATRR
jgi:hypothetical protein